MESNDSIKSNKTFLLSYGITRDKEPTRIDEELTKLNKLQLKSYQLFATHYISPNSTVNRLYIKYGTGVGKTATSLKVAINFISEFYNYHKLTKAAPPMVHIIGFTKNIFKRELLKFPEFGYITRSELEELLALKSRIFTERELLSYNDYVSFLRRRITNKKFRGYFQFYGYRELVNLLFDESQYDSPLDLANKIAAGKITPTPIIHMFHDSLIICDEIHNTYNSLEKNYWGSALQFINQYYGANIRMIYLSATPINHSPGEIIDLLNLLHYDKTFNRDIIDPINDTALKTIGEAFAGKLLFLENADPASFPVSTMLGEPIIHNNKPVPILRFIKCKMSRFNYETYKAAHKNNTISQDGQYIQDIAFPNPDTTSTIGLYKTSDRIKIANAPQAWKNKIGINADSNSIRGSFLRADKIAHYSTKYARLISDIMAHIKAKRGKIFIYHRYVRMSGVLLIQEILRENGIIGENDISTDATIDFNTGAPMGKTRGTPVRFIIVHSDIDVATRNTSLEKFNSPSNVHGNEIMILLGADIMKESYDLKAVRSVMVCSKPDNISTLIQIFGRSKRQNSHIDLPPPDRSVSYSIYIQTLPDGDPELSYEERRYIERIEDYIIIQQIEKAMHENATDFLFNWDIIQSTFVEPGNLGVLAYDKPAYIPKLKSATTNHYRYYYNEEEINRCVYIIKRLFIEHHKATTIDDLIDRVRDPPFNVEYNTMLFDKNNIISALHKLLYKGTRYIQRAHKINQYDALFTENMVIQWDGAAYIICQVGTTHYVLCQLDADGTPQFYPDSLYRHNTSVQRRTINISYAIKNSQTANLRFEDKLKYVYNTYFKGNTPVDHFRRIICDFDVKFHEYLIEHAIMYIIQRITDKMKKSPYEEFYVFVAAYYGFFNLTTVLGEAHVEAQKHYITPESQSDRAKIAAAAYLSRTLPARDEDYSLSEMKAINPIFTPLYDRTRLIHEMIKNHKITHPNMLPIGHNFGSGVKYYGPDGWFEMPSTHIKWQENDIVIAFHHREEGNIISRLKIRTPKHMQKKQRDARKVERGNYCHTYPKKDLIELAKKLNIDISVGTQRLCTHILYEILNREYAERVKGTNIKYYYHFWESNT